MGKSNKVIFNTIILYCKMVITIIVSLYSTRLILNALGVNDYGIYNLIGGVILMLSFLQASMSASTQRFLSFYKGKGNVEILRRIFSSSVTLHFIISLVIVLLLELLGLPFITSSLSLPATRIETAKIIFHLMVAGTFLTVNSVPYEGALNSNENMTFISLIGILEVVLKFVAAVALSYVTFDKLIFYTLSVVIITFLCRIISVYYCKNKYEECSGGFRSSNKKDIMEMFAYAGWNSFGALCAIARNQGIAIVLNVFYGVIVNAAYGIANQVSAQLGYFSQSMIMALRPQIVKSEGEGDREKMLKLSIVASKFSVYFMAICSLPFLVEMPFILKLWLKTVPENTIIFCRLVIILNLVVQMSTGLMIAVQSVGKIKYYQAIVGTCVLLSLPIGYLVLKLGHPAFSILLVAIAIELLSTVVRLLFARNLAQLSISTFIFEMLIRAAIPVLISLCGILYLHTLIEHEFLRFVSVILLSTVLLLVTIYYVGLNQFEKEILTKFYKNILNKLSMQKIWK